jgi:hypothetical protein
MPLVSEGTAANFSLRFTSGLRLTDESGSARVERGIFAYHADFLYFPNRQKTYLSVPVLKL